MPHTEVITFASSGYADLLHLWAAQSLPNLPHAPTIVCLDQATEEEASRIDGVRPRAVAGLGFDPADRQTFWINRLTTVIDSGRGKDMVIHSDLDAFWLKPAGALLDTEPFDLAFSIDFALPNEIKEKWGFILCCGFFAYRPGTGTDRLLALWLEEARRYYDDQIAINRLLHSLGIVWTDATVAGAPCKAATIAVGDRDVRIVALPWTLFHRRHPMAESGDAFIAHPFWERRFHRSFVQSYDFIRRETTTLPPLPLPPFPGDKRWRDYDWSFLHVLEWIAQRTALTVEQTHHLGVLSTRFGQATRAVAMLGAIEKKIAGDDYFALDYAEALDANGERLRPAKMLRHAILATSDLTLLKKIAAACRERHSWPLYLLAVMRAARIVLAGKVAQVARRKLRNAVIGIHRRG